MNVKKSLKVKEDIKFPLFEWRTSLRYILTKMFMVGNLQRILKVGRHDDVESKIVLCTHTE